MSGATVDLHSVCAMVRLEPVIPPSSCAPSQCDGRAHMILAERPIQPSDGLAGAFQSDVLRLLTSPSANESIETVVSRRTSGAPMKRAARPLRRAETAVASAQAAPSLRLGTARSIVPRVALNRSPCSCCWPVSRPSIGLWRRMKHPLRRYPESANSVVWSDMPVCGRPLQGPLRV